VGLFSRRQRGTKRADRQRDAATPAAPAYLDWIEHYTLPREPAATEPPAWSPPSESETRKVS